MVPRFASPAYKMPSDQEDNASSRPQSDSSADDTDSPDSDIMPRLNEPAGVRRKSNGGSGKKASGDPNREKRKKAKRACRPCQVAHLTCGKLRSTTWSIALDWLLMFICAGDERPCSRCVKRGCSHMCKDGVRKKAKYLADTPAEALTQELGTRGRPPVSNTQSFLTRSHLPDLPGGLPRGLYGGPLPYNPYTSTGPPQPLAPLNAQPQTFGNGPGLLPPNYSLSSGPQSMPTQGYGNNLQQNPSMSSDPMQAEYSGADMFPFDSNYMDLSFENKYAAAEFGMLGSMTSAITHSPPSESTGAFQSGGGSFTPNTGSNSFAQSPVELQHFPYQQGQGVQQWPKDAQQKIKFVPGASQSGGRNQDNLDRVIKQEAPPAFAIGSSAYPSPNSGSSPQGTMGGREDNTTARNTYTNINQQHQPQTRHELQSRRQQPPTSTASTSTPTPTINDQTIPSRRHRNPSEVYNNVKHPYSYTAGFHSLTALIQGRFSPKKTAHIAKALAAIRPSFISCTMRLNRDDLIFMEKCLQRTLWGLEEVISATGTPTIICRRTGEVVAAGKEFSILTGWSKDVLLGKAPNMNVNKGGENSGLPGTGASSRGGQNTPRAPEQKSDAPVNIVNLLDDESACDFFDDYAHLAFGDSRGTATTPCKLLRYKTAEDMRLDDNIDDKVGSRLGQHPDTHVPKSYGKDGMQMLGQEDGKIECMLCWTVKRDVFDIPMLFVMNVSCHKHLMSPRCPLIIFPQVLPCI